jgi:hypothetical protein
VCSKGLDEGAGVVKPRCGIHANTF